MTSSPSRQLYAGVPPRLQAYLRDFLVQVAILGRVSFGRALARTAVKLVLGLWVFVIVYFTRRSQGLHDLIAGTVVVPRDAAAVSPRGFAFEKAAIR